MLDVQELLNYMQHGETPNRRGEGQGMRGDSDGRAADSGTGAPCQGEQPALSDGNWLNWASTLDLDVLDNSAPSAFFGLALTQVCRHAGNELGRVSGRGLCPRRPCPGLLGLASEAP